MADGMVRFAVKVMSPASNIRSTTPRASDPLRTLAVGARTTDTFQDVWRKIRDHYSAVPDGTERDLRDSDRLQDAVGADILMRDLVGSLYSERTPVDQLVLRVQQVDSAGPSTALESRSQPQGLRRRAIDDLDTDQRDSAKRRKVQRDFSSVVTDGLVSGYQRLGDDVRGSDEDRLDKEGFKVPKRIRQRQAKQTKQTAIGPMDSHVLVRDSQPDLTHLRRPGASEKLRQRLHSMEASEDDIDLPNSGQTSPEVGVSAQAESAAHATNTLRDGATLPTPDSFSRRRSSGTATVSSQQPHTARVPRSDSSRRFIQPFAFDQPDVADVLESSDPIVDELDVVNGAERGGSRLNLARRDLHPFRRPPRASGGHSKAAAKAATSQDLSSDIALVHMPSTARTDHLAPTNAFERLQSSQTAHSVGPRSFNIGRHWTAAEDSHLRAGVKQKWSAGRIVKEYNLQRTPSSVRCRHAFLNQQDRARLLSGQIIPVDDAMPIPGSQAGFVISSQPSSHRKNWTSRETTTLKNAIAEGYGQSEIRAKFFTDRSQESIRKRLVIIEPEVLNVAKVQIDFPQDVTAMKKWHDHDSLKLRRAYKEGLTLHQAHQVYFARQPIEALRKTWRAYVEQMRRINVDEEDEVIEDRASVETPQDDFPAQAESMNSSPPLLRRPDPIAKMIPPTQSHEKNVADHARMDETTSAGTQMIINWQRDKGKRADRPVVSIPELHRLYARDSSRSAQQEHGDVWDGTAEVRAQGENSGRSSTSERNASSSDRSHQNEDKLQPVTSPLSKHQAHFVAESATEETTEPHLHSDQDHSRATSIRAAEDADDSGGDLVQTIDDQEFGTLSPSLDSIDSNDHGPSQQLIQEFEVWQTQQSPEAERQRTPLPALRSQRQAKGYVLIERTTESKTGPSRSSTSASSLASEHAHSDRADTLVRSSKEESQGFQTQDPQTTLSQRRCMEFPTIPHRPEVLSEDAGERGATPATHRSNKIANATHSNQTPAAHSSPTARAARLRASAYEVNDNTVLGTDNISKTSAMRPATPSVKPSTAGERSGKLPRTNGPASKFLHAMREPSSCASSPSLTRNHVAYPQKEACPVQPSTSIEKPLLEHQKASTQSSSRGRRLKRQPSEGVFGDSSKSRAPVCPPHPRYTSPKQPLAAEEPNACVTIESAGGKSPLQEHRNLLGEVDNDADSESETRSSRRSFGRSEGARNHATKGVHAKQPQRGQVLGEVSDDGDIDTKPRVSNKPSRNREAVKQRTGAIAQQAQLVIEEPYPQAFGPPDKNDYVKVGRLGFTAMLPRREVSASDAALLAEAKIMAKAPKVVAHVFETLKIDNAKMVANCCRDNEQFKKLKRRERRLRWTMKRELGEPAHRGPPPNAISSALQEPWAHNDGDSDSNDSTSTRDWMYYEIDEEMADEDEELARIDSERSSADDLDRSRHVSEVPDTVVDTAHEPLQLTDSSHEGEDNEILDSQTVLSIIKCIESVPEIADSVPEESQRDDGVDVYDGDRHYLCTRLQKPRSHSPMVCPSPDHEQPIDNLVKTVRRSARNSDSGIDGASDLEKSVKEHAGPADPISASATDGTVEIVDSISAALNASPELSESMLPPWPSSGKVRSSLEESGVSQNSTTLQADFAVADAQDSSQRKHKRANQVDSRDEWESKDDSGPSFKKPCAPRHQSVSPGVRRMHGARLPLGVDSWQSHTLSDHPNTQSDTVNSGVDSLQSLILSDRPNIGSKTVDDAELPGVVFSDHQELKIEAREMAGSSTLSIKDVETTRPQAGMHVGSDGTTDRRTPLKHESMPPPSRIPRPETFRRSSHVSNTTGSAPAGGMHDHDDMKSHQHSSKRKQRRSRLYATAHREAEQKGKGNNTRHKRKKRRSRATSGLPQQGFSKRSDSITDSAPTSETPGPPAPSSDAVSSIESPLLHKASTRPLPHQRLAGRVTPIGETQSTNSTTVVAAPNSNGVPQSLKDLFSRERTHIPKPPSFTQSRDQASLKSSVQVSDDDSDDSDGSSSSGSG